LCVFIEVTGVKMDRAYSP